MLGLEPSEKYIALRGDKINVSGSVRKVVESVDKPIRLPDESAVVNFLSDCGASKMYYRQRHKHSKSTFSSAVRSGLDYLANKGKINKDIVGQYHIAPKEEK